MSAAISSPFVSSLLAQAWASTVRHERVVLPLVLLVPWALHVLTFVAGEPFYNNDEARHFMTGVFLRDFLMDGNWTAPRAYAEAYFLQYPALSLLTWPPFYYGVEGVSFSIFGISLTVAKLLIGAHATLAAVYIYLLARHTHGVRTALLAVLLWSLSPLVFEFSRHVMLEMPTLAYSMAATYHLLRHLDTSSRRQLLASALFTSCAALTRFDGFFLLLAFALILLGRRQVARILTADAAVFFGVFALAVVPYYVFMAREIGWFHWQAITIGTGESSTSLFDPENFLYYLHELPAQLGWPTLILGALGLAHAAVTRRMMPFVPWLALFAASFLMASSVAEVESRHSIYGLASVCVFAAYCVGTLASAVPARQLQSLLALVAVAALIASSVVASLGRPALYVKGYAAAADYVIRESGDSRYCLFDGVLDANFTYHIRRDDPDRSLHVLRGDKLFYTVLSDTRGGYRQFAESRADVLSTIERYDPRLIIVENSESALKLPAARLLRETLAAYPDRFRHEATFAVDSNRRRIEGTTLLVYRKLTRNPRPERELAIPASGLRELIGPTGARAPWEPAP